MSNYKVPPKIFVKSNFEKVLEFNKAFGVKTNTKIQHDIFDKDPKLIQLKLDLILEEVQELKDAIQQKDMTETIDALTDILYVVYGGFTALFVNADDAFNIVQDSNMSKLCDTEEDAIESVKRYKSETPQRYDSPAYRLSDDNIHWIVYNQSTMKVLKSYKYTPADFTELLI